MGHAYKKYTEEMQPWCMDWYIRAGTMAGALPAQSWEDLSQDSWQDSRLDGGTSA